MGTSWSIPIRLLRPPPLANRVITPYAAVTEQVHDRGLERDQGVMEGDEQEQEREADYARDEQRHSFGDVLALVLERRRDPADVRRDPGASQLGGHDLLAQPLDQVLRFLVLRLDGITLTIAAVPSCLITGSATN